LNIWETHCIKKKTIQTTAKPAGLTMKREREQKERRDGGEERTPKLNKPIRLRAGPLPSNKATLA